MKNVTVWQPFTTADQYGLQCQSWNKSAADAENNVTDDTPKILIAIIICGYTSNC